jgi:uncharacterized protein with NRDE domain
MCLIVIGWKAHANYSLVVFANRDEYHDRPTGRAEFWGDEPELLAGRDRRGGGTWLGLTRQGRFAAITNVREPDSAESRESTERQSRGRLVHDYLLGTTSAEEFATEALAKGSGYAGFNLFVGDRESLYWVSNRADSIVRVEPGVYGVSNGGFDEAWPKVVRVKDAMGAALEDGSVSVEDGLVALASRETPADDALPETGVEQDVERQLGSVFVRSPTYGTRSSTVIAVKADQQVTFVECVFDEEGEPDGSRGYAFSLDRK